MGTPVANPPAGPPSRETLLGPGRTGTRLLAILTVITVAAALKWSMPVTLPLVIGLFFIALAWPLQIWLERRMPQWAAIIITSLAALMVVAVIASALVWSLAGITQRGPQLGERLRELAGDATTWARARGLPVPAPSEGLPEFATGLLTGLLRDAYSAITELALAFVYLVLGLLEVRDFENKIGRRLRERLGDDLLDMTTAIATKVRRYLWALTITCVVSGVATGLFVWAVGVELALMWGFAAFLLNYIPVIGPFIAIIPPSLYALLQFDGLERPLTVLLGVGAIQFFIGNFVDPKITGRVLSLSPVVVLFAIVLWGWIWGSFGALLSVPLTVAIVIACQQFQSTRWVASLMTTWRKPREQQGS